METRANGGQDKRDNTAPATRLIIASGESNPDLYYKTRFLTPDPYIFLEIGSEKIILVNDLEIDRAKKESTADRILPTRDWEKILSASGKPVSSVNIVSAFLEERKIRDILVPFDFPLGYADAFRKNGFNIAARPGSFYPERALKTREEAHLIRTVQVGVEESLWEIIRWLYISTAESVRFFVWEVPIPAGRLPSEKTIPPGETFSGSTSSQFESLDRSCCKSRTTRSNFPSILEKWEGPSVISMRALDWRPALLR